MTERERFILGLRAMADFLGTHPDVPCPSDYSRFVYVSGDQVRPVARQLRSFKKEYQGTDFHMTKEFGGGVSLSFWTARENVCKKIVVATKEVPEMIIAAKPEQVVPATEEQIIPAHTEEITEWVCSEAALLEDPQGVEVA